MCISIILLVLIKIGRLTCLQVLFLAFLNKMYNYKKNARTKSDRIASLMNGDDSSSEKQVFEVESILDKKTKHGIDYYLVSWKNYPVSDATWQPKSNMTNCNSLILEYQLTHLPNEAKADLEEIFEEDKPFRQPSDPLPPDLYLHNLECLKENSTLSSFNSILSYLEDKIKIECCIGDEIVAEIIGSEIENEGEAPTWFRVKLPNGELRRTRREELLKNRENKRRIVEYYQTLVQWK